MRRLALLLATLVLPACGAAGGGATTTTTGPDPAAARRQEALLLRDIESIHAAAQATDTSTLHGTPALRRTTTRFLDDLSRSPDVERLRKNRLIDHAAGALGGTCDQCFQQLEAVRPIVTR
jgi:hypothetical protein